MIARATDIDIRCVYMCYVQLSLLGVPAVVIQGNSLLMSVDSVWETPMYTFIRLMNEIKEGDEKSA